MQYYTEQYDTDKYRKSNLKNLRTKTVHAQGSLWHSTGPLCATNCESGSIRLVLSPRISRVETISNRLAETNDKVNCKKCLRQLDRFEKLHFKRSEEEFWEQIETENYYLPERITKLNIVKSIIFQNDFCNKRILDISCDGSKGSHSNISNMFNGSGRIYGYPDPCSLGVDPAKTTVIRASRKVISRACKCKMFPWENDYFDYVVSTMLIDIVDNPDDFIKEICRVLKKAGRCFLGIIHPDSEIWDEKSGLCFHDSNSCHRIEARKWIYNTSNGPRLLRTYIHRPLVFYQELLQKYFHVIKRIEPRLPENMTKNGKYASQEYLFWEIQKR